MSTPVSPVEIGQTLAGKYRIDRVLGAGGMGVVVAATHLHLDQRVAIKFLLPEALGNPDVVARFQREARAVVKIHSEHVARVSDVGVLDTGAPYMVMEYLEGTDLAEKIATEHQLAVGDAARFVLEACEALAEAHAAGIVHRDLKPANLFLARRADRTLMVKVLDFGISKASFAGGSQTSTQTVMGSPYYMSPEQLMSAKHVDARSDVWSLGIVLHEALIGKPPYLGDSMPEIVAKILSAAPPSVSASRPDVPAEIDALIARCLAKDPNQRVRDVAELARALVPFVPGGQRSLDRISRVLGEAPADDAAPVGATTGPQVAAARTAAMDPRFATPQPREGPAPAPNMTASAWAGTQHASAPAKRSGMWIGLGAGTALLAAGGIALFVMRSSHTGTPTQPPTGIVAAASAPVTTAAALPTIPPAPLAPIPSSDVPTFDLQAPVKPVVPAPGPKTVTGPRPSASTAAVTPAKPPPSASAAHNQRGLQMDMK